MHVYIVLIISLQSVILSSICLGFPVYLFRQSINIVKNIIYILITTLFLIFGLLFLLSLFFLLRIILSILLFFLVILLVKIIVFLILLVYIGVQTQILLHNIILNNAGFVDILISILFVILLIHCDLIVDFNLINLLLVREVVGLVSKDNLDLAADYGQICSEKEK